MNFEWNENMAVGNKDIDNDHKYLFSLIRTIDAAIECHVQANVLEKYVELMVIYTAVHFSREEQYQKIIGFKEIESHKLLHVEFSGKLNSIRQILAQAENDQEKYKTTAAQLNQLVRDWWSQHIMIEDLKMKETR